jgi:hypothetical protein
MDTSEQAISTLNDELNIANIKITEQAAIIETQKATAVSTAIAHAEVRYSNTNCCTLQLRLLELCKCTYLNITLHTHEL